MGVPKVKPLVWVDGRLRIDGERETAESIFGTYEVIRWSSGDYGGSIPDGEKGFEFGGLGTMGMAKSVARADYESRILSALDLSESE